jgi:hypothetical protein
MPDSDSPKRSSLSRRDALKWFTGTAAGTATAAHAAGAKQPPPHETEPTPLSYPSRYILHDPDYTKPYVAPWENVMTPEELSATKALADIILPKDDLGPAASECGVAEFINEWISAPYEEHHDICEAIRGGLGWLNTESFRRFEKRFDEVSTAQQTQIVDDICDETKAMPEHKVGARFFKKFRKLALGGYYTHSSTWKHLGYVGNTTVAGPYPGVPDDIVKKYGLEDVA